MSGSDDKSDAEQSGAEAAVANFLAQPAFVEDEELEDASVREEQRHGEQRVRFAITHALAPRHEHR
jgi:hypothetical protein